MKDQKKNTVGTFPKSSKKIVERGNIDTPNTQIHEHSLLKKISGFKLD